LVCDYFYRHHVSLFINTHAAGEILADGPRKEVGVECTGDNSMPMLTIVFSVYEKYNALLVTATSNTTKIQAGVVRKKTWKYEQQSCLFSRL
jgi:hypothetical protein